MKNLRKIVESMVEEFIEQNPPPDAFTGDEVRAAAQEFLDVFDATATIARSLDRIADVLEREELRVASRPR